MYENLLPFSTTSFQLVHTEETETAYSFYIQSIAHSATCPNCHAVSSHRHSCTNRTIQDLPMNEKKVYYFSHSRNGFVNNQLVLFGFLLKEFLKLMPINVVLLAVQRFYGT